MEGTWGKGPESDREVLTLAVGVTCIKRHQDSLCRGRYEVGFLRAHQDGLCNRHPLTPKCPGCEQGGTTGALRVTPELGSVC